MNNKRGINIEISIHITTKPLQEKAKKPNLQ